MKSFKKELRSYWTGELEPPPPYPFASEYALREEGGSQRSGGRLWLQNCAGIAVILGLIAVLGTLWGDPGFSPVQYSLDVEGLQDAVPLVREFLLTII